MASSLKGAIKPLLAFYVSDTNLICSLNTKQINKSLLFLREECNIEAARWTAKGPEFES
jgi:hypothetical protein